jgi:hypothetical protein
MNGVNFACLQCRQFLDAGYRWAYHGLEKPGIVQQQQVIDVPRVLAANEYWDIGDSPESAWLREGVLPKVRAFLAEHESHGIVYVEDEWLWNREDAGESWTEIHTWGEEVDPGMGAV